MPGWITVFRAVPWAELIAATPAIARGARKLWTDIRREPRSVPSTDAPLAPGDRIGRLEAQVAELREELASSSEIMREMAEQNEKLVVAVSVLRARQRLLMAGVIGLIVVVVMLAVRS